MVQRMGSEEYTWTVDLSPTAKRQVKVLLKEHPQVYAQFAALDNEAPPSILHSYPTGTPVEELVKVTFVPAITLVEDAVKFAVTRLGQGLKQAVLLAATKLDLQELNSAMALFFWPCVNSFWHIPLP